MWSWSCTTFKHSQIDDTFYIWLFVYHWINKTIFFNCFQFFYFASQNPTKWVTPYCCVTCSFIEMNMVTVVSWVSPTNIINKTWFPEHNCYYTLIKWVLSQIMYILVQAWSLSNHPTNTQTSQYVIYWVRKQQWGREKETSDCTWNVFALYYIS